MLCSLRHWLAFQFVLSQVCSCRMDPSWRQIPILSLACGLLWKMPPWRMAASGHCQVPTGPPSSSPCPSRDVAPLAGMRRLSGSCTGAALWHDTNTSPQLSVSAERSRLSSVMHCNIDLAALLWPCMLRVCCMHTAKMSLVSSCARWTSTHLSLTTCPCRAIWPSFTEGPACLVNHQMAIGGPWGVRHSDGNGTSWNSNGNFSNFQQYGIGFHRPHVIVSKSVRWASPWPTACRLRLLPLPVPEQIPLCLMLQHGVSADQICT